MDKTGRKSKDANISDNFNRRKKGGLSRRELARLEAQEKRRKGMENDRLEREKRLKEKELARLQAQASMLKKDLGEEAPPPENDPQDSDDVKSAYQMLQDMRWVYRKLNGRKKLHDMVKADDKQFVFMCKELMKIEASLMSAKIRAKDDGSPQQTVFVVIKGLGEEKGVIDVGNVDLKQISLAINPDGTEYEGGK